MKGAKQSRFLVLVRDGTYVSTHHLEICVLAGVIDGHLEHAQMEVGNWAERSARDEDDGLFLWMVLKEIETVVRKGVIRWCCEAMTRSVIGLLGRSGHDGGL
jgi:hypothetical protein